jgi:thymidylate synthase
MTKTDETYLQLLQDIIDNGKVKYTRSGQVKSIFGRQLRFDLKEGLPLLTTKKVFTKGIIHELLWFLQRPYNSHGSMNIEYLIRNGVHIWDDDAYRWFKNDISKQYAGNIKNIVICINDDEKGEKPQYEYWIENDLRKNDTEWLTSITKEEFLDLTLQKVEIFGHFGKKYRFGDLGPIYGKQWRAFGSKGIDQINQIIETLKTNPSDRRMLCLAFNPDQIDEMALPPCHVMMQFYTRELTSDERMKIFNRRCKDGKIPKKFYNWYEKYIRESGQASSTDGIIMPKDDRYYEKADIPKYGLSCMWTQRSVDAPLGLVYNVLSYSVLTNMIAKLTNMVPDELIASLGDCHIYLNQMEGVLEQLGRSGYDDVPQLVIKGKQKSIDDFEYDDFEIVGYKSDPVIKFPLSVG